MGKVRRMNTETHQRFAFERLAERSVPSQARHPSPTISYTVDQRSCRKRFAGPQIAHRPEPCGVFHFCIAGCSLCFAAEQPRRRDETAWLQPAGEEFIARGFNSSESLVVSEIVKLAFALGVKLRDEFLEKSFMRLRPPFMKISVDHDLVPGCFQAAQP